MMDEWQPRGDETYWGEPTTDEEKRMCETIGNAILFDVIAHGV